MEKLIDRVRVDGVPRIAFIKRTPIPGRKPGVFASSFNPITVAHVELMRRASESFSLDETIAVAAVANADKLEYECSLQDRLEMLMLTFAEEPGISVGLSSHA